MDYLKEETPPYTKEMFLPWEGQNFPNKGVSEKP